MRSISSRSDGFSSSLYSLSESPPLAGFLMSSPRSYARRLSGSLSVSKASRTRWKASVEPVFLSGWYFSERRR